MRTTAHPPGGIRLGCSTSTWWVEGLWGEKNTQTMEGSETIYTFAAGDCTTLVQRLSKGNRIFSPYLIELKSWLWELTEYLESLAWKSFSNLVHSKFGFQSAYTHCPRSPSVPLLSLDYCFSSYWFLFPKPTDTSWKICRIPWFAKLQIARQWPLEIAHSVWSSLRRNWSQLTCLNMFVPYNPHLQLERKDSSPKREGFQQIASRAPLPNAWSWQEGRKDESSLKFGVWFDVGANDLCTRHLTSSLCAHFIPSRIFFF